MEQRGQRALGARNSLGIGAWIYRDDSMEVERTIRGNLPTQITVRGVGGTVNNVTMEHEGQVDWIVGRPYLVFLRFEATPTKEGWEEAWTVTWLGHGSFDFRDGRWTNGSNTLQIDESDIAPG